MKKMVKTINADGSIVEVEADFEVWKFDKDDFWQNDWQERKRKQENSIEELSMEELGQVVGGRNVYDLGLISDSAELEYFRKFSNEILQKAMSELSEKQRRRIILRFFREFTNQQIAEIEKCSERSVEIAILLGIQNLKKVLENF